jgi:protein-S-isoprenylcysteine O-methyltransferase Ste14
MMYISALIIIAATLAYGVVHSFLASLGVKEWARRWLGRAADRYYRLAYNVFGGLSFLPVLALVGWLPDRQLYAIPLPWLAVSLALQGLAVVLLLVGVLQTGALSFLGLRQLVDPRADSPGELVVAGLYRWMRHPLYTAGLVFIWLSPVMSVNLLALNLGLTAYIVIGAWVEERKLLKVHGEPYARYMAQTSFLIPWPPRRG